MSRAAKETDDEMEPKVGRRLKALGSTSVVDSPLRRSTRHKQPISQDDGSSPESVTSDSTGPPMQNSKRKTATVEYATSEITRSLRSRRNSTASDTMDNVDVDSLKDMKKRITRRSIATVQQTDTPTKTRLRRSTRAGSESNTLSPSLRTTRRTRASSVDLEDSNETLRDKSLLIHLHTPLKTRNRASALPSEPVVIEESDNFSKDVQDSGSEDTSKITNATNDSSVENIRSPLLRLNYSNKNEMNEERSVDETSVTESIAISMELGDNVSGSPLKDSSKPASKLKEKMMSGTDSPKVVLYKADLSSTKSSGNKENEKSEIATVDEASKNSRPNIVSQRKSASFILTKKSQVKIGLNRSVDSISMANIDSHPTAKLTSSPNNFAKSDQMSRSINDNSRASTNTVLGTNDSGNESIIILEEKQESRENEDAENDDIDNETTYMEPQLANESLKNGSPESRLNGSVIEVDTTVDNFLDGTVNSESNDPHRASSVTTKHEEESSCPDADVSQYALEKSAVSISVSADDSEDIHPSECATKTTDATHPNDKKRGHGNNIEDDEDGETDEESLFRDILAEEWKADRSERVMDECNAAGDIEQNAVNQNVASPEKDSSRAVQTESESKMVENFDHDSNDTVIMETRDIAFDHSDPTNRVNPSEDKGDFTDNGDETETDQEGKPKKPSRRKSLSVHQRRSSRRSSLNLEIDEESGNDDEIKKNKSHCPNSEPHEKSNTKIQETRSNDPADKWASSSNAKSTEGASRRSLNIKSVTTNQENKMRRRTIEKMNSGKYNQSREESISTESNEMEIDEDTNCDGETIGYSVESSTDSEQQLVDELVDQKTLINKSKDKEIDDISLQQHYAGAADSNSSSDSESNNGSNQSARLPEFLFNVSTSEDDSSDKESASINSDVERELNLNGESSLKYSDDDVAGDDCRASETEESDEDGNDDDDMADFIVDDDEDIEEEEESSENDASENEEDSKKSESDDDTHETPSKVGVHENGKHSPSKSKLSELSTVEKEKRTPKRNRSSGITEPNPQTKLSPRNQTPTILSDTSTKNIRKRSSLSKTVTPDARTARTPKTNIDASETETVSMDESSKIIETPARKSNSSKLQSTPSDKSFPEKRSGNPKIPRSKSLSDKPLNQSMQAISIESPEVKQLMSEKLNSSLPILKLQGRSLKVSRRSSLIDVEEVVDERSGDPSVDSMAERSKRSGKTSDKQKKNSAHKSAENSSFDELNEVPTVDNEKITKKKRLPHTENSLIESEDKPRKKKKSKKQKVDTSVEKSVIDTEQSSNKSSKKAAKSETQLSAIEESAKSITTVTSKRTRKDLSRTGSTKPQENKSSNVKRLPEDFLENLSDSPVRPKKRIKLDPRNMPSKTMFDTKDTPDNVSIDDVGYISVSASGGTSQFSVVNLQKLTTKRSKKSLAALSFRERLLQRNPRQPISAYLMYQQKLKASGKNKY